MFFKDYLISLANMLDVKFKGYEKIATNSADKGELCELFMKEFLIDSFGDIFKIFRGGRIVNCVGAESKQIDIIITDKRAIKIFGDKGIYPVETVKGCFSITSTLTKAKLINDCKGLVSIPKDVFSFRKHDFMPQKDFDIAIQNWKWRVPYKVIFAFKGKLNMDWAHDIVQHASKVEIPHNALPDLIIVNKIGYLEKEYPDDNNLIPTGRIGFSFVSFKENPDYSLPFVRIMYYMQMANLYDDMLKLDLINYFQNRFS